MIKDKKLPSLEDKYYGEAVKDEIKTKKQKVGKKIKKSKIKKSLKKK